MSDKTPRQIQWEHAAREEARRGNDLLAGLFALLALPSKEETSAQRAQRERQAVKDSFR